MNFITEQSEAYYKAAAQVDRAMFKGINIADVASAFLDPFHIIWGYSSILNPYTGKISNLTIDENIYSNNSYREFNYKPLPFACQKDFDDNTGNDIALAVKDMGASRKYFERLPYLNNPISAKTPLTYVSNQLKEQHEDLYVVLFEEVLFYIYAHYLKSGKSSEVVLGELGIWGKSPIAIRYYRLKMLCRFALLTEAWTWANAALREETLKMDGSLHEYFGLTEYYIYWSTKEELLIRSRLDRSMDAKTVDELYNEINTRLPLVVSNFLTDFKRTGVCDDSKSEAECIQLAARFDIPSAFRFQEHYREFDLFVLSVYHTRNDTKKIRLEGTGIECEVFTPVLFIGFLETIGGITKGEQIDETEQSIDGFFLTKLVMKLFSQSVVQGKFINEVVRKHLNLPLIRAAISQVMARNMSHNLGSHVISKLIDALAIKHLFRLSENRRNTLAIDAARSGQKDTDIYQYLSPIMGLYNEANISTNHPGIRKLGDEKEHQKRLEEIVATFSKFQQELNAGQNGVIDDAVKALHDLLDISLNIFEDDSRPTREKAAYFNSYLKTRMDFLADIATGKATLESPKQFFHEVIANIDRNRILLDRISGVEKFPFKFKVRDCRRAEALVFNQSVFSATEATEVDTKDDILVSIPNDILGCHAFYIILENLIRNTAKHSTPEDGKEDEPVIFTIDIKDCEVDKAYYQIEIYDNRPLKADWIEDDDKVFGKDVKTDGETLYAHFWKSIGDAQSAPKSKLQVYQQKLRLNQSILDKKTGRVRQGALGLIEMEVSAAYLRKLPVEMVDSDEFELPLDVEDISGFIANSVGEERKNADGKHILPLFVPFEKKGKAKASHLGYRFYMMKPKEILVRAEIGFFDELNLAQVSALREHGILLTYLENTLDQSQKIFPKEVLKSKGIEPFQGEKVYEQQLLLMMGSSSSKTEPFTPNSFEKLSNRQVAVQATKYTSILKSPKAFLKTAWEDYYAELMKHASTGVDINAFIVSSESLSHRFTPDVDRPLLAADFTNHGSEWATLYKPESHYLDVVVSANGMQQVLSNAASVIKHTGRLQADHKQNETTFILLKESIQVGIAVFDERVQEAAQHYKYSPEGGGEIPFSQLYEKTGIFVPSARQCNLLSQSFKTLRSEGGVEKQESEWVKDTIRKALLGEWLGKPQNATAEKRVRYLVIHLGVLEKLLEADGKRPPDFSKEGKVISQLLFNLLEATPWIKAIITTGRGVPGNLPPEFSYVNFSALSQYCIEARSKFALVNLLAAARRPQST